MQRVTDADSPRYFFWPERAWAGVSLAVAMLCFASCQLSSVELATSPPATRHDVVEPAARPAGTTAPPRAVVESTDAAPPWHGFGVRFGGAALGDLNTNVRLDSKTLGRGTEIDFEDNLGFTTNTDVFRFDAFHRFNRYHRVDFSYFDIQRTSGFVIDEEIQFGNQVIPINANVTARFNTEIFKGAYRYTFLAEDTWEVGASIGLHWMRFGTGITANNLGLAQDFVADAPLPVLGVHCEWLFAPRFRLIGSAEFLYVELKGIEGINDLEGALFDSLIAIEWDAFDFAGIGVGYNFFFLNAEVGGSSLVLSAEYEYQGLLVFGTVFF